MGSGVFVKTRWNNLRSGLDDIKVRIDYISGTIL